MRTDMRTPYYRNSTCLHSIHAGSTAHDALQVRPCPPVSVDGAMVMDSEWARSVGEPDWSLRFQEYLLWNTSSMNATKHYYYIVPLDRKGSERGIAHLSALTGSSVSIMMDAEGVARNELMCTPTCTTQAVLTHPPAYIALVLQK